MEGLFGSKLARKPVMLIIACLSQKGGVGKSTFSQLIATTYAHSGWATKIADFNTKQKSSTDWVAWRQEQQVRPDVSAETFTNMGAVLKLADKYDLVVCDGRPDSDTSSMEIARKADLIVIPVGTSALDLKPQVLLAHELQSKGISRDRMLFVINRTVDSQIACDDARDYVTRAGYLCAESDIPLRTAYQMAQATGRALIETNFTTLNARAEALMKEIVKMAQKLQEAA